MIRLVLIFGISLWSASLLQAAELASAYQDAGVARISSVATPSDPETVFEGQNALQTTGFAPPPAPGADQAPASDSTEATFLELFEADEEDTTDAESGDDGADPETPKSPDTVFNSQSAGRQGFHRVFIPAFRVPYLGPRGRDGTPPGTTNTWVPHPCQASHGNYYRSENGTWLGNDKICDVSGAFHDPYDSAFRFGWWGVSRDGSPAKTGMYQDLESSPFWDIDMIRSDGQQTMDFWMSGLDEDANAARGNFYFGPGLNVKLRYQGYLRNLGHDPLFGAPITGPLVPADRVVTEDLNVGQDYAIRVQQLDTKFQGRINENMKWRVNVWMQRKFGERQTNSTAHCFDVDPGPGTNRTCHVLSQRQNIDWRTLQIEPSLEANFGNLTVEYSHMLRTFGQDDQIVTRTYDVFAPFSNGLPWNYAYVPDNITNIDRLKMRLALNDTNEVYGNVYYGNTENQFRDTSRQYSGLDVRYTNRSLERLTTTTYFNVNADNNSRVPFLIAGESDPADLRHPIDHTWMRAGIKGSWQPIEGLEDRFSIATGYEYFQVDRNFAQYDAGSGPFSQPDTSSNRIEFGPQMRWSRAVRTFVRYQGTFVNDPLLGANDNDLQLNTNLPTQSHRVEIGGSWNPSPNFMTTAQFGIVDSWNKSTSVDFSENSYPFSWTVMLIPTQALTVSGGYGYYSNWLDQDVTLGYRPATETTRFQYAGENHVANINLAYAWSPTVQLIAGYEYNYGNNVFTVPASVAGADWSQLASFSDVKVEQNRVTAGADWQPYQNTTLYLRYIYFDFDDIASGYQSGTAHMGLAGAGVVF